MLVSRAPSGQHVDGASALHSVQFIPTAGDAGTGGFSSITSALALLSCLPGDFSCLVSCLLLDFFKFDFVDFFGYLCAVCVEL